MRDPRRMLCTSVLVCEALVVFFAALVAKDLSGHATTTVLGAGGGLALLCLLAAGLLRGRLGYLLGSLLQLAVLACGFVLATMFFLGAVFGGLWVASLVIGRQIDHDRATAHLGARRTPD